jgi:glycosyltransferase involved in cell wall biosynthesis
MRSQKTQKLFIDALPLAQGRMSGIGHLVLELTKVLTRNDNLEIILVVPLGKRKAVLRHGIKNLSVKTFPLPARVMSVLMRLRLLPPVDIVLGRGVYLFPNYRNWPLLFSKSLTYFHDVAFMLHPETVSPKNLKYLRRSAQLWLKRTDTVLTLTDSSKQEIVGTLGTSADKIRVIPCGVDMAAFYPREKKEISTVKERYNINSERYILCVGNLEPRKNIDRLLEAYRQLSDDIRSEYALVLIGGGGWLNDHTLQLIEEMSNERLNIIHPDKYVEDKDMPAIYSGATLVAHPAIHEGFGIPILEAMACGIPVAASNIPSIIEVVDKSCLYFDPYSVESIESALHKGLSDKTVRQELIGKGKKRAAQFSWDNAALRLQNVIQELQV